jgi:hypothetical protein
MRFRITAWVLWACPIALAGVSCAGCAGLATGTGRWQEVYVDSLPQGAAVTVDGVDQGFTPTRMMLDRKRRHDVHIALAGYRTHERQLRPAMNNWFWGNFLLIGGFPIGMGMDVITGSVQSLSPVPLRVRLIAGG